MYEDPIARVVKYIVLVTKWGVEEAILDHGYKSYSRRVLLLHGLISLRTSLSHNVRPLAPCNCTLHNIPSYINMYVYI